MGGSRRFCLGSRAGQAPRQGAQSPWAYESWACSFIFMFRRKGAGMAWGCTLINSQANVIVHKLLRRFLCHGWIIMAATEVQRQNPGGGLGSLPPKAENQRVKTADDNHAHANFYFMHSERVTGLQRNVSAIRHNGHQMCSPTTIRHFLGVKRAWPRGSRLKMPLFQGLASKSTKK